MRTFRISAVVPAFTALALGALAPATHAQSVLINSFINATGTAYFRTSSADSPLGQQFTLSQAVNVSDIRLWLGLTTGTVTNSGISLSILNDNANTFGSIIAGATSSNPTGTLSTTGFNSAGFNFSFTDLTLQPGTYWLQLTSNQGTGNLLRWLAQNSTTGQSSSPGGYGTFNNVTYVLGNYKPAVGGVSNVFAAQISGVSAVPELSTLALMSLAGAMAGVVGLARRARSTASGAPAA
jgi:hypothetical protein